MLVTEVNTTTPFIRLKNFIVPRVTFSNIVIAPGYDILGFRISFSRKYYFVYVHLSANIVACSSCAK